MADTNALHMRIMDSVARTRLQTAYRNPEHEILVELIDQLDLALRHGESLPIDWSFARKNLNLNGCPIEPGWARPAEPDDLADALEV